MSERKVLNKYYPPDFDPSKIPRMKLARNRQYTVRLMAPFNMRCKTCGEYIYKGKKFNARKEDVEGDDYLGIRIYRFYIKCTRCLQEISFKTDPKNTDYEIEAGATRNFMALKLAEEQAQREEDEEKEEEATNPMKLLEKRTQQSKQELELLESLEELKDLNRRQQTIDYEQMLAQYDNEAERQRAIDQQEKLDEAYVESVFRAKRATGTIVEEEIVPLPNDEWSQPPSKLIKISDGNNSSKSIGSCEAKTSTSISKEHEKAVTKKTSSTPSLRSSFSSLVKPKNPVSKSESMVNTVHTKVSNESSSSTLTVDDAASNNKPKDTATTKIMGDVEEEKKVNGLSLLCSYSNSSDNDSD
ncbi:splicing factor YJU2 [Venturia canescens]|uniref:splicing factor YJU2 n=1 Tax=Venturia canescens TaxID=32260 RepID=UPI001C9BD9C7|nr:splicing factor YJU2 [Venturia canescens]